MSLELRHDIPRRTRTSPQWEILAVLLLLSFVTGFYGLTIQPNELGNDDSAQYLQHAKNISEGAPYDRITWVYHEGDWNPGPRVYPPVFPLLLAPFYHTFGLRLGPMHFLILAFFVGSLIVIYLTFRGELGFAGSLGLIAIIGLNPYFWDFKNSILSDTPFLCMAYLALLTMEKAVSREDASARFVAHSALVGVLMYLACGTRSVGVVMVPAILVWSIVRRAKIMRSIAVSAAVCIGLELAEIAELHTLQSYYHARLFRAQQTLKLSWMLAQALRSARYWLGSLSMLWDNGFSRNLRVTIFALSLVLVFFGITSQWLQKDIRIQDAFGLAYIPMLLSWMEMRYLIPLVPLYLFYLFKGTLWLMRRLSRRPALLVLSTMFFLLAFTYGSGYRAMGSRESAADAGSPESQEMFAVVRKYTSPDDVIECIAPRTLSFYTGRRSSMYPYLAGVTPADMKRYFCQARITYVLVAPNATAEPEFYDFVRSHHDSWSVVFQNNAFQFYRVPAAACPAPLLKSQKRG